MSDDECPPAGIEAFDAGADDDMGEDMGDYAPPPELPDGVAKEVLTPSPVDNWKKPKAGDEVTVHYVGTLESDGSEFDSSRARGNPFVFTLGKGQVIKGWDVGVATMKKGEVAKFTLSPEFGYGAAGSPPKIPENATLVFEVELLGWTSKDDLFGDEGVIKAQLVEGSGWKTPKAGDEVLISVKAVAADGSPIEERADFEYTLGSGVLGALEKACGKALLNMKKGEVAELKCTKDYSYEDARPDGCTLTLTLQQIYETKDTSIEKNRSLMKKQVLEGQGYDTPKDTAKVKLFVESATDGSLPLPGFEAKVLEFTAGDGEVCDALECAVADMKKGERAVLTVSKPSLALEPQLGLKDITAQQVVLTLELQEFEKARDTWSFSEEEKLDFGRTRKEVGGSLFKRGRVALALLRYKKVVELFSYVDNYNEENKQKAIELKQACELNKAACFLKLGELTEARSACDAVLKEDKCNAKALYRRAQAELGLKNFTDCMRDCKRIVEADPQNREARILLKQAQTGQKEVDQQMKGLFANMCKALGKGPVPKPGEKKADEMDEDAEDVEISDGKGEMGEPPAAEPPRGETDQGTVASNGNESSERPVQHTAQAAVAA